MTDITHPSPFMSLLDIQFDELGPTRVSSSIAADERHRQPWGLVHGGLNTAAIETFATTGGYEPVRKRGQQAVGVSNVTDFMRPHRSGRLEVVAVAVQQASHAATLAGRCAPYRGRQARRPRSRGPAERQAKGTTSL